MLTGKDMENKLIDNIDKIHTTEMGISRIKRNLGLENINVINWCKERILNKNAIVSRQGKNWYVSVNEYIITINANSFTVITVHKINNINN